MKIYIKKLPPPHDEKLKSQQDVLQQEIGPLWEGPNGKHYGREEYEEKLKRLFMTNECIQCKVAMHIAAIKYCLENDIHKICDGSFYMKCFCINK